MANEKFSFIAVDEFEFNIRTQRNYGHPPGVDQSSTFHRYYAP
jgi:hypothetical protein